MEQMNVKLSAVRAWVGVGSVIFYAGALTYMIYNHETRLNRIEASGSPPISEHIKLDDKRYGYYEMQLAEIKRMLEVVNRTQLDVAELKGAVTAVKENTAMLAKVLDRINVTVRP